jgi:hypothetical protein
MGTSPLPNPTLTPPLGGTICPDPRWAAGRGLVLQGPQAFLGARWVLTASLAGQPAQSPAPPVPPVPPPGVVEGAIPFADITTGTGLEFIPPPETSEGSTVFLDEL